MIVSLAKCQLFSDEHPHISSPALSMLNLCIIVNAIVWTGIQADLAFGGNFFHSHPLSTHIWYQNVQLTFRCQFRKTFTEQDSKWKQKATKSIHWSSRQKKGFPMVFPGMRTRQVQRRNWNGGVGRFFLSFSSLSSSRTCCKLLRKRSRRNVPKHAPLRNVDSPAINWLIRRLKVEALSGRRFRLLCLDWNWFWHSRKIK